MAAPSAVQSRRAVVRSTIFPAVGALDQVCACAPGGGLLEGTMLARGSCMPDHASSSQIENLVY